MVKPWIQEAGDARSVIEPIVRAIRADVDVDVNDRRGISRSTAVVTIRLGERTVRCVVTYEAWEEARRDDRQMQEAFRRILRDSEGLPELPAYLLTRRGLDAQSDATSDDILRDLAASVEADILAEESFKKASRK